MAKIDSERLKYYKDKIKDATSKKEVDDISYEAFKEDTGVSIWDMALGKKCLSNEVSKLCVRRILELEGYSQEEIRQMEIDAKKQEAELGAMLQDSEF